MFKRTSKRVYIVLGARKPDISFSEDRFLMMGSMTFCLNLFPLKDISSNTTYCLNFVEKCLNSSKNVYMYSSGFFRLNFVYTYNG